MQIKIPKHNGQIVNEQERRALLDAARSYIGTPWKHLGRNVQGLDCVGLLIAVGNDVFGISPEISDYSSYPDMKVMREMCNRILTPIRKEDMRPGDVALMYAPGFGVVHLGWYAGETLIHANNAAHAKKVVETTIHPDWNLRGAYAVPRFIN